MPVIRSAKALFGGESLAVSAKRQILAAGRSGEPATAFGNLPLELMVM